MESCSRIRSMRRNVEVEVGDGVSSLSVFLIVALIVLFLQVF